MTTTEICDLIRNMNRAELKLINKAVGDRWAILDRDVREALNIGAMVRINLGRPSTRRGRHYPAMFDGKVVGFGTKRVVVDAGQYGKWRVAPASLTLVSTGRQLSDADIEMQDVA